jgi:hypothetical protein
MLNHKIRLTMKKIISVLFYATIAILVLGFIFRIVNLPGGNIFMTLGQLGMIVYFTAKTIKDFVLKRIAWLAITLQILMVFMSFVLFSKYMFHSFGDYPGLIIIPLFIIVSVIYFVKSKVKFKKLTTGAIAYLLLSIPLFGISFHKGPIHYIPKHWHDGLDVNIHVPLSIPRNFEFEETEKLCSEADKLRKEEDFRGVILVLEEARTIEPKNTYILFNLSEAYANSNKLELAVALLDTAIMIDDSSPWLYGNRGLFNYNLGFCDKAIVDLEKASQLDSTNYVYFANLSLAYYEEGYFNKARESIKKAELLGVNVEESRYLKRIKDEILRLGETPHCKANKLLDIRKKTDEVIY